MNKQINRRIDELEKRISVLEGELKDGNMAIAQMVDVWLAVLKDFATHYHVEVPELYELIEKSGNKSPESCLTQTSQKILHALELENLTIDGQIEELEKLIPNINGICVKNAKTKVINRVLQELKAIRNDKFSL